MPRLLSSSVTFGRCRLGLTWSVVKPALAVLAPRHAPTGCRLVAMERVKWQWLVSLMPGVSAALEPWRTAVDKTASASPSLAVVARTTEHLEAGRVVVVNEPEVKTVAAADSLAAVELLAMLCTVPVDVIDAQVFGGTAACAATCAVVIPDLLLNLLLVAPLDDPARLLRHAPGCFRRARGYGLHVGLLHSGRCVTPGGCSRTRWGL